MTNHHYLSAHWSNKLIYHSVITAHNLVWLCSLLYDELLMAGDRSVSQRERHRPQPLLAPAIHYSWWIYRGVGGGLAGRGGAWSSRGHGTHSLVRSIKHGEPAFWLGNWAAWALPLTAQNGMLSLDLKSTHKGLLCTTAHPAEGGSDLPLPGPRGLFCGASWESGQFHRLQRHRGTCDFNLVKACFLLWLSRVCHLSWEAGYLLREMPRLPGSWRGICAPCSRHREMQLMRKVHIPRKIVSCPLCFMGKRMGTLDCSDGLREAEGGKSLPDEDGGGGAPWREKTGDNPVGACNAEMSMLSEASYLFSWCLYERQSSGSAE